MILLAIAKITLRKVWGFSDAPLSIETRVIGDTGSLGTGSIDLLTINPQQCGWWIEIGTAPLVEALRKFLACSESDLEQMGRNGRKLVEDKYTSEAVAMLFLEMYKALCKNLR